MNAVQWTNVQQVYELVKQEGDARCEQALADLIPWVSRALAWRAVCESRDAGWAAVAAQEELRRLRLDRDGWMRRALDAEEALRGRA